MTPPVAVEVGDLIGATGRGDVGLDDDEIRLVIEAQALDVLVVDALTSTSGSRYEASVARPSGGNKEYLIGRNSGLVASVRAGRIIFTRFSRLVIRRHPGGDRPGQGRAGFSS